MEKCIAWCDENRNEFIKHFDRIRRFRDKFRESSFRNLRLFGAGDLTRLVIFVKGVTGKKASELLEEKTGVVVEMAGNDYLVFISTVMDSDEDFDRLTPEVLERIFGDVTLPAKEEERLLWRLVRTQPKIEAGIVSQKEIRFEDAVCFAIAEDYSNKGERRRELRLSFVAEQVVIDDHTFNI